MSKLRVDDFICDSCKTRFELFWRYEEEKICPECKSTSLTKALAAPRIVSGVQTLKSQTPEGFKDLLKQTIKTVPEKYRGKPPSSI